MTWYQNMTGRPRLNPSPADAIAETAPDIIDTAPEPVDLEPFMPAALGDRPLDQWSDR